MVLEVITHKTAESFLATSGAFLERRESENNLLLGIPRALVAEPDRYGNDLPRFWSVVDAGGPVGAAIVTPPRRLILSRVEGPVERIAGLLLDAVLDDGVDLPGVVGPVRESDAFLAVWRERTPDLEIEVAREMRVFECRSVADVTPSSGRLRPAESADHELLTRWALSFGEAIQEPESDREHLSRHVRDYIESSVLYVWDDGGPVSMAKYRPTKRGATLNFVYTPDGFRNRGYATSCVGGLTRKLLAEGRPYCSLFTDLANPTSNSIYQRIGYQALGDWGEYDFLDR